MLDESVLRLSEQVIHHGSLVPRVEKSMEMSDFFNLNRDVPPEARCYELAPPETLANITPPPLGVGLRWGDLRRAQYRLHEFQL